MTEIGAFINGLTEDTTPDPANDLVMTYDNSTSSVKKAKLTNVIATAAAPADATYLTTSANTTLSAEVVVTAPATGGVVPKVIVKASTETVNNSAVLQNDDELLFAIGASEKWIAKFFIITTSGTTPDFKANFTGPASCTIHSWCSGANTSGAGAYFGSGDTALAGFGSNLVYEINVLALNSTNAGNIQLQWAQNTQNASNTQVLAGSCLLAWKIG